MATEDTVLEHLLQGRDALVLEVRRLTTAIDELDGVIVRLGGSPAGEVEAPAAAPVKAAPPAARKTAARKAPAKRAERRPARSAGEGAEAAGGGKSIRVHVLEMLGAEDREFGLTEIIDHIRGLGIQAHDDAVRSITIKLMKDGQVERVGRGQYRLAGRGSARPAEPAAAAAVPAQPAAGYVPPMNFDQEPQG